MNRFLIASGIVTAVAVISAIVLSCSQKAKAQDIPGPEKITSFRFESFIGKVWYDSDVYSLSLNEDGSYLYWRKSGSFTGTGMGYFNAGSIYSDFEKAVKDYSLDKYPYTPLDKEDKEKDRWMIRINYKDGHQISIVNYVDNPVAGKDLAIIETIRGIFAKLLDYIDEKGIKCEHSRYTYDPDGKLSRRIDYTADGIVHGGWDADNPMADF